MIGIIGAMSIEVEGLISSMTNVNKETIFKIDYYKGDLFGIPCVVAQCGPGKVNAGMCANTMILSFKPSLIINPGVAGGIGKGVHIGDVVVAESCVQHDSDTTVLGDPKGFVSGVALVNFPCDKEKSEIVVTEAKTVYDGNVFHGVIATGDQFIASGEKCMELKKDFNAIACEMEAGAIAHACYIGNTPFVGIRSISDNANESGDVDFMTFAKSSAEKTHSLLSKVIAKL